MVTGKILKKMLAQKGQISLEVIGIAAVVLMLFLIVALTVFWQNISINAISSINQNTQKCNKIAALIENFYSSIGYSETKIELGEKTIIDSRSINVNPDGCPNCQYCYYYGDIDNDLPLTLEQGTYDVSRTEQGVKFTIIIPE